MSKSGLKPSVLGDIPLEWEVKKLEDIAKLTAGGTPSTTVPEYWGGDIPWMSSGEIHQKRVYSVSNTISELGLKNSSAKWIPEKSIFIALAGQGKTRGTVAISEVKLTTNQSVAAIILDRKKAFPDFVFHNLDSRYLELRDASSGDGRAGLNLSILGNLKLSLPPLLEQERIARVLSSVDDLLSASRRTLEQWRVIRRNVMQFFFAQDATQKRMGWQIQNLFECAKIQTGIQKGKKYKGRPTVEVPYLRVANVQDDYLDLTEVKTIHVLPEEVSRYQLLEGDVLLTEGGDADKLGRGHIWQDEVPGAIHQNHIFCVRVNTDILIAKFFNYLTSSQYAKKYFLANAKQSTNLASINISQLKKFPCLIPSLKEQERIVNILSSFDNQIKNEQAYIARLETLKKGLMQQLLTGRLRVRVGAS